MREIILIGAGGHAKVIIAAARQAGRNVRAIYDDDGSRWDQSVLGVPIKGPISQSGSTGLPAVLAFDNPLDRKAMAIQLDLPWATVIHPSAFINPSSRIGPGCVIMEAVVIQPSVQVGRHVVVSANATISHDSIVEDFVRLGPGVDLAGSVHIDEGVAIEVGGVVIPSVRVGKWTIVGPRGTVIRNVPDNVKVAGIPAKFVEDDQLPLDAG
jgi:sugar O-acyltransferase (sialic acid O-acetyltransferase NeuD family)